MTLYQIIQFDLHNKTWKSHHFRKNEKKPSGDRRMKILASCLAQMSSPWQHTAIIFRFVRHTLFRIKKIISVVVCVILTKIASLCGLMVKDFAYILRMKNSSAQTVKKCMVLAKHLNIVLVILNKHAIQFSDTASMNKKCLFNTAALLSFVSVRVLEI